MIKFCISITAALRGGCLRRLLFDIDKCTNI